MSAGGHPQGSGETARVMLEKANKFLATLFPPHRDLTPGQEFALFRFGDDNREEMHYLAPSAKFRRGLPLRAMNNLQRQAALELLEVSLSKRGFEKVEQIRMLEHVLAAAERGQDNAFVRDAGAYFFTLFGTPAQDRLPADSVWGWRYEGHHISLHWTILGDRVISSTPQFLGAQPAKVPVQVEAGPPAGTRVLGREEDLAWELWEMLSQDQRLQTMFYVPWDIETSNTRYPLVERRPPILENRRIAYSNLSGDQQKKLQELVAEYAAAQVAPLAGERLERIEKAGWDKVQFFRMGGLKRGDPHYYRVRGSTFLIEYDNTSFNQPDHQHTVWRDFSNDWGRDVLAAAADSGHASGGHTGYGPDMLKHHYETADHHAPDRARLAAHRARHAAARAVGGGKPTVQWDIGRLNDQTVWMPTSS